MRCPKCGVDAPDIEAHLEARHRRGWGRGPGLAFWHYFVRPVGLSLCGKWPAPRDLYANPGSDCMRCTGCNKALQARDAQAKVAQLRAEGRVSL